MTLEEKRHPGGLDQLDPLDFASLLSDEERLVSETVRPMASSSAASA